MIPSPLRSSGPAVVGHRGAAGLAPENTMAAFAVGAQVGADWIECDVHRLADGPLVVLHDETVDRTTNGRGEIARMTVADIRRLDAGRGQSPPLLDDLLTWLESVPTDLVIEIKNGPNFYPGIAPQVAEAIVRHGVQSRVMVISFDHLAVRDFKHLCPDVPAGVLYHAHLVDPVAVARSAGADALWPSVAMVTPELVAMAHSAGLAVFAWTASTPDDIRRMIAIGIDGFGSDFPDLALELLGRRSPSSGAASRKL